MAPSLLSFLESARSSALSKSSPLKGKITAVLGNPSCDLDSIVSAVVLSYFYNLQGGQGENGKASFYVPLLNLPSTPSSDLWRLRPEFGTALRLANGVKDEPTSSEEQNRVSKDLLKHLITLADLSEDPESCNINAFSSKAQSQAGKQPTILVDHNAPSVSGVSTETLTSRLELTGCIDHHVDESVIPSTASPRIIQTGIGSCASLIVQHLRDEGFWPYPSSQKTSDKPAFASAAKLALAPILIDTFNLKATGDKVSDTDRNSVSFLESHFSSSADSYSTSTVEDGDWNRDAFFDAIHKSKQNALNLLTLPEILAHDYKEWSETPTHHSSPSQTSSNDDKENLTITIGIPSLVKPLTWLVEKSGSAEKFTHAILDFARTRNLDIVALIAKSTSAEGKFRKELAVIVPPSGDDNDNPVQMAKKALESFEQTVKKELNLREWSEDEELLKVLDEKIDRRGGAYKIWWQGNTEKSRKQVAPALREAVKNQA